MTRKYKAQIVTTLDTNQSVTELSEREREREREMQYVSLIIFVFHSLDCMLVNRIESNGSYQDIV